MKIKNLINFLNVILLVFAVINTSAFKNFEVSNVAVTITILSLLLILDILSLLGKAISVKELLFYSIVVVLAIVITYESKSTKVLMIIMYIFACRLLTIEDAIRTFGLAKFVTLILTFGLYLLGYLNDINNSIYGRHSFGFGHPNTLGATIFIFDVCLLSLFFMRKKTSMLIKWISVIIQIPLFILLYLSKSRGAEIGVVVALILTLVVLLSRKNDFLVKLFSYITIFIVPSLSIFLSEIYLNLSTGNFVEKINNVLSNRLYLSATVLNQYGIAFFGQNINYNFNLSQIYSYVFLDNAYMELLINYGVISLLFIFLYHYFILKKGFTLNMPWISIIVVSISVYAFVEQGYDQFWINPVFSMSGFLFLNKSTIANGKRKKTIFN